MVAGRKGLWAVSVAVSVGVSLGVSLPKGCVCGCAAAFVTVAWVGADGNFPSIIRLVIREVWFWGGLY